MPVEIKFKYVNGLRKRLTWQDVPGDYRFGLYIVQSETNPTLFRVGAGGVGSSTTSTLAQRLKAHTTGKAKPSGNPTERYKLWKIIWFATLKEVDKQATLLAELALMSECARRYCFVHASIFHYDAADTARVVSFARSNHSLIREIARFQSAKLGALPLDLQQVRGVEPTDAGALA